jgi:uncharacterized protein (DUF433 family)
VLEDIDSVLLGIELRSHIHIIYVSHTYFKMADAAGLRHVRRVPKQLRKLLDVLHLLARRFAKVLIRNAPAVRTRVPVKNLFDYLEGSSTLKDLLEDFPSISRTTAVSVLEAARERLALDATAA